MKGVVIKSTGSYYNVMTEDGSLVLCRLRGKLRIEGIRSTNPIAVGDIVIFELEANSTSGIITQIEDRKNYLVRKSVNLSKQIHIIAANIDLLFLVITIEYPKTYAKFIDRILATAEAYSIKPILVFNKIDCYSEQSLAKLSDLEKIYNDIGYTCFKTNALQKVNISALENLMIGKTSMITGHSGTGKSTLINAINPELDLKTSAISNTHQQGIHTTTFAEMFPLPKGGYIIDTPGIKGFGAVDFEKTMVTDYFPEFFKLKSDCKFNNCLHLEEPKCAIKQALDNGTIAFSRYESYVQLLHEDKENENYRVENYG